LTDQRDFLFEYARNNHMHPTVDDRFKDMIKVLWSTANL